MPLKSLFPCIFYMMATHFIKCENWRSKEWLGIWFLSSLSSFILSNNKPQHFNGHGLLTKDLAACSTTLQSVMGVCDTGGTNFHLLLCCKIWNHYICIFTAVIDRFILWLVQLWNYFSCVIDSWMAHYSIFHTLSLYPLLHTRLRNESRLHKKLLSIKSFESTWLLSN